MNWGEKLSGSFCREAAWLWPLRMGSHWNFERQNLPQRVASSRAPFNGQASDAITSSSCQLRF